MTAVLRRLAPPSLSQQLRDTAAMTRPLMLDIIALGFQTDKTRVASLLLARDLSALYYPFLGVSKQHHGASHYDTEADYQKIVHFQMTQLAYLAQKLDAMLETLWAGFLDAPTNGLPTHVADYVAAYTSATRLKMTLLGYSAFPGKGYRAQPAGPAKSKIP